jgi:hypothetical protein
MLMQEAEVRSSAGCTFVRTEETIWQALQVRSNATLVRSNVALHCVLSRACAHTQTHNERSQVRERSRIGGSAFDHKDYVRTYCRRLIFPKTELN